MQRSFRRLAIVNRGEPAMRVIHAVRELNQQGREPIRLIALYTESERQAMFVRLADEAVCIGPSLVEADDGSRRSGYLDYPALERALVAARADVAWVGWGFVAEQPEFAELCERLGIVFAGPDAATMRRVGDKIEAKRLAEEAGVPVAPWSGGAVAGVEQALEHAERIGLPLMIKAAAGGGGRGIRVVEALEGLPAAFASARAEALQAFGDGTLLLERLVTSARHVEVQVIADGQGTAWAVGVRDCSYQRRNQKVIEESASPALDAEQEREVMDAAQRLALRVDYRGACTVEFLYEPAARRFSFMEVNARLQVEHPVTEAVTGLDLVKLQLHVAAGGRLEGEPRAPAGHAIEARLCAEDPSLGFLPAPGRVALLRLPTGPGLRVDTGVAEGDVIPAEFDSMIAKLIAWGQDREEALARLRRALADTTVVIDGGTTNQGFLLELLDRPEVRTGDVDTTWLDRMQLRGEIVPVRHADIALLQGAIELSQAETAADRARFYAFARRGRPLAGAGTVRTVDLRHRGSRYRLAVAEIGPGRHRVTVDGETVEVVVDRVGPHERRLELRGETHRTVTSLQGADLLVDVDGVPHRISRDDGGLVRNLSPAVVVSIPVAPGDEVAEGDVVAVVESMKMESSLTAPFDGRVRRVLVEPERARRRPGTAGAARAARGRVAGRHDARPGRVRGRGARRRSRSRPRAASRTSAGSSGCCSATTSTVREVRRIIADMHGECADVSCDPMLIPGEHRLLALFADLAALTRPHHEADEPESGLLRSPREHLFAWLRSLDADAEGLPAAFTDQLRRALAHYGVESLDRTPELEAACYRLFLSHERAATARPAVLAILDRRLQLAGTPAGRAGDDFREALDRLVPRHGRPRRDPRGPRPRGPVPLLRRADHRSGPSARLRRDGAPPRCAGRRSRPRGPRRAARGARRLRSTAGADAHPSDEHRGAGAATRAARDARAPLLPRPHARRLHRGDTGRSAVLDQPVPPRRAAPASRHRLRRAGRSAGRGTGLRGLGGHGPGGRPRGGRLLRGGRRRRGRARGAAARGAVRRPAARHRPSHRGRRQPARARPGHVGDHAVHVPSRARGARRTGRPARHAPDDVAPPPPLPARGVQPRAAGVGGGRLPVPRHRALQPEGRAALRPRRGARSHTGARRGRARRRAARARARARRRARGHTPLPGAPQAEPAPPVEPHPAARLAHDRVDARGDPVAGRPAVDGDRGPGRRDAARPGPAARGGRTRARAALLLAHRARRHRRGRRSPDAAAATARRERAADDLGPSPRAAASGRDRQAAGARAQRRGPRPPARRAVRRARPRRGRTARPGRPAAGDQPGGRGRGADPQRHRAPSGGNAARDPARRSDEGARIAGRARVPADHGRTRPRRGAGCPARVVRALRRREDRHGQRHREHGLDRRRAPADHRVHAGGRGDQRRGGGDQRRRPAVLERRGDDADAHPRHPRDDPGERDGAHRQAGARLLRRRVRGGQLRHRRLRADHGP